MTGYTEMAREARRATPYGAHPVWRHNSKLASRELAALAGVQSPTIYEVADEVTDLTPPDHPFVLKPNNGSGGKAVFPLIPSEDGLYRDLLDNETRSWGEVVALATRPRRRLLRDNVEGPWLIEELLLDDDDRPLCNWKFWCFGGEPAVVAQALHRRPEGGFGCKWWSPEWEDVGDIRPHRLLQPRPDLPAPEHPERLLEAARRVAAHVPASFIRVDLYNPPSGPMLGEITPHPGGAAPFLPEWERHLGALWREAEK